MVVCIQMACTRPALRVEGGDVSWECQMWNECSLGNRQLRRLQGQVMWARGKNGGERDYRGCPCRAGTFIDHDWRTEAREEKKNIIVKRRVRERGRWRGREGEEGSKKKAAGTITEGRKIENFQGRNPLTTSKGSEMSQKRNLKHPLCQRPSD